MISSRLIKSNNTAAGCVDIVDAYDPFGDSSGLALYQLNGNANDVSGNYNGTATSVTYGTGVFGQAGVFNGSSSKITLPNVMNFSTGEHTISSWLYIEEANEKRFISNFYTGTIPDGSVDLVYSNPDNAIFIDFRISTNYTNTIPNPPTNQWIHIVATFVNNGVCSAYLNGSLIDTVTAPSFTATSYQPLNLGYYQRGNTYFNGSIDQVRIFNTALDPLEIEALYTEELCLCGGTVDTLDILDDSSCIALYPLDGNANDLSGNYSGTPTNVSYGVGEFDLAGVFNGSSSYINTNLSLPFNGVKTISMWFKANSLQNAVLFEAGPNIPYYGYSLVTVNDGRFYFIINNSNHSGFIGAYTTGATYAANTWYNVVSTQTASVQKTYLNGVEIGTVSYSTTSESYPIYLAGGSPSGFSGLLNGSIDQVRIFNKALNSTEVTTLYNETACTPAACTSGTTNTLNILGDGSCIATYTLDGTPADLSGNYNGVQTNVTYPQGYFDLAGSFNGDTSWINTGSPILGTGAFSYSLWFNFSSLPSGTSSGIISNSSNTGSVGAEIRVSIVNNKIDFFFGGGNAFISSNSAITTNTWYHAVGTYDGTTVRMYLNNVLQTQTATGTLQQATSNLHIGTSSDFLDRGMNGQIDQVRIFNKALSAGEVTTLYNETPCN